MAAGAVSPTAMSDDVWEAFANHSPVPSSPSTKTTSASSSSSTASSCGASTASTTAAISTSAATLSCRCRRSTSDLTDLMEEEDLVSLASANSVASVRGPGYSSRPTSPSPGSHRGSRSGIGGGLAYLASRRGSRDSQASEDPGPLAFAQSSRATRRRTSNFLELPVADHIRPRVCSLPEAAFNPRGSSDESAFYRLRTFSTTNKGGVVNRGDALISRHHRSKSNTSVNSTASRHSNASGISPGERSPFEGSCCGSSYVSSEGSVSGIVVGEEETPKYRVVLLGDAGVGKTALVSQFMTSEYMNTYDASLDDEFGEKTVSVLLDGEESELVFIDHPSVEMSVENSLSTYAPHACVVVYSVVDRATFKAAEDTLRYLWKENFTMEKAVILVGNKADLARARTITTQEGKSLAMSHDCKFIETSSGIQHNVDELLVGVLKQVRLRESRDRKLKKKKGNQVNGSSVNKKGRHHLYGSKTSLSLQVAREILSKMCLNDSKSKSCENLHVL